jgi:hypothetical protein
MMGEKNLQIDVRFPSSIRIPRNLGCKNVNSIRV